MKRALGIFLVVSFGLSWGLWIPAGLALQTFEKGILAVPVFTLVTAVAMFFPLIGALVANAMLPKGERVDLGVRLNLNSSIRYYLIAWFLPAGLTVVGLLVYYLIFPGHFDTNLTYVTSLLAQQAGGEAALAQMGEMSLPILLAATFLSAVTVAPFINAIPAFGEEAGWRGFLFPVLCSFMSTRRASLLSGVVWGLWHAPIIAMGHNYGREYAGFPVLGILAMVIACVALGCWLCLLRQRAQSVWPCALAHGAFNAVANIGVALSAVGPTVFGPSPLGLVAGIPMFVLGAFCFTLLQTRV